MLNYWITCDEETDTVETVTFHGYAITETDEQRGEILEFCGREYEVSTWLCSVGDRHTYQLLTVE